MTEPTRQDRAALILIKLQECRPMIGLFATDADMAAAAGLIDRSMSPTELPVGLIGPVFDRWMAEAERPRAFPNPRVLRDVLRAVKGDEAGLGPGSQPAPERLRRCRCDGGWLQGPPRADHPDVPCLVPCQRCRPDTHQRWADSAYEAR